jgi:hypothetical protein
MIQIFQDFHLKIIAPIPSVKVMMKIEVPVPFLLEFVLLHLLGPDIDLSLLPELKINVLQFLLLADSMIRIFKLLNPHVEEGNLLPRLFLL